MERPSWDEYFLRMAYLASERSTCIREDRKVGAVAVKEKRILATGYNGAPKGIEHCIDIGCMRKKLNIPSGEKRELCRGVHAEENVVAQAATYGISIKDATIYCTHFPCSDCVKLLINAEVREIVYDKEYSDKLAKELLEESNVILRKYSLEKKVND